MACGKVARRSRPYLVAGRGLIRIVGHGRPKSDGDGRARVAAGRNGGRASTHAARTHHVTDGALRERMLLCKRGLGLCAACGPRNRPPLPCSPPSVQLPPYTPPSAPAELGPRDNACAECVACSHRRYETVPRISNPNSLHMNMRQKER